MTHDDDVDDNNINSNKEEYIVVDNLDDIVDKLRYISYWHYIFTNNSVIFKEKHYKTTNKFIEEVDRLLPLNESVSMIKEYIEDIDDQLYIKADKFNLLIKDLSVRICTNVLRSLSEQNIIIVSWDDKNENFAFQINPKYLDKNIISPKSFLKKVYLLARKHLKLRDHYRSIKK